MASGSATLTPKSLTE